MDHNIAFGNNVVTETENIAIGYGVDEYQGNSVSIGQHAWSHPKMSNNVVVVGANADIREDCVNSCAFGYGAKAGSNAVAMGYNVTAEDGEVVIGPHNIGEMKKEIDELRAIINEQSELINALWYNPHPRGPGAMEVDNTIAEFCSKK